MLSIRRARSNEWENLQELNDEVFTDNSKYDSDLVLDWARSEKGEAYFKGLVIDSESICLVAEDEGVLVGYIAASPKDITYRKSKYIEIDNMGVIPEYRSQGVGKMLMDECLKIAKERGFQKAYVNCYSANDKAINFYKKNGFGMIDVILDKVI